MKNNKLIVYSIPALLILILFCFSYFYTYPKIVTNNKLSRQYDDETISANSKIQSIGQTETLLTDAKDLIAAANVAVADDKDTPNVIAELEKIASRYGSVIPSVEITDGGASVARSAGSLSNSNTVSVSFTVSGSVDNMEGFVKTLENDLKIFNIKSLVVSSSSQGVSLSIQAETYKSSAGSSSVSESDSLVPEQN